MVVEVSKLNVKGRSKKFFSTLFLDTSVRVLLKRPITENVNHVHPEMDVEVDISSIHIDFKDKVLGLITGILVENVQEKIVHPDVKELTIVEEKLAFDTSKWISPQIDAVAVIFQNPKFLHLTFIPSF